MGEEEAWVSRDAWANDKGRKGFVGMVKGRQMEKAPAGGN